MTCTIFQLQTWKKIHIALSEHFLRNTATVINETTAACVDAEEGMYMQFYVASIFSVMCHVRPCLCFTS